MEGLSFFEAVRGWRAAVSHRWYIKDTVLEDAPMEAMPGLRFRAAVLEAPGQRLTIETVDARPPGVGVVLVRIAAAALCHTDLEVITGQLVYPMPIVLGHEAAGIIAAVGPGVDSARVGERVVLSWNPHCGRCFHCTRGQPILCDSYVALGPRAVGFDGATRLTLDGRPVHTMFYMAAFAEYAVVTDAARSEFQRQCRLTGPACSGAACSPGSVPRRGSPICGSAILRR
jgi:Zn-dependent alcohol dehydrogenase